MKSSIYFSQENSCNKLQIIAFFFYSRGGIQCLGPKYKPSSNMVYPQEGLGSPVCSIQVTLESPAVFVVVSDNLVNHVFNTTFPILERAKGAFLINAFLNAEGWPRLADSRARHLYYRESSCGFLIQISQHNLVIHVFNTILIHLSLRIG